VQAVLKESKQFSHLLEWCLIASLLLHAAIMFTMPKPDYDLPPPKKQEIRIELVKQTPPAPPSVPEPTPTPPAPTKPQPTPPQPQPVKPTPKPVEPTPVVPQKPSTRQEQPTEARPVVDTPAPAVIAAKPTVGESKPEMVVPVAAPPAPPPEPVKAAGPSEGDIEAARNAFKEAAQREIQKNLRYPRIALERGIEGVTHLHISFDDHGNITNIEVTESSGNKALDEAAIATVKKSQFKALFNDILRGRLKSTNVPVSFKLDS